MLILQEGLQFTLQFDHQHSGKKKLIEHLGKKVLRGEARSWPFEGMSACSLIHNVKTKQKCFDRCSFVLCSYTSSLFASMMALAEELFMFRLLQAFRMRF